MHIELLTKAEVYPYNKLNCTSGTRHSLLILADDKARNQATAQMSEGQAGGNSSCGKWQKLRLRLHWSNNKIRSIAPNYGDECLCPAGNTKEGNF